MARKRAKIGECVMGKLVGKNEFCMGVLIKDNCNSTVKVKSPRRTHHCEGPENLVVVPIGHLVFDDFINLVVRERRKFGIS